MNIQDFGLMSNQEFGDAVNKQHYSFAHRIMPYIVDKYFHGFVDKVINESAQDEILRLWRESSEILSSDYTALVYPQCHFIQPSNNIGVIFICMPAPRARTEVAYAAVVMEVDKRCSPDEWLRTYFTLELGLSTSAQSAHWILGEWNDSTHINLGEFEYEPTVESFLAVVVAEGQRRWQ